MLKPEKIYTRQFRGELNDADILLYRGTGIVSLGIRGLTKSHYSHAGLVARWNDRVMVLEAVGNGVVAMPLSTNLEHHSGTVDYYRTKDPVDPALRLGMVKFAQVQLGKRYAFWQMARFGCRLLFGMKLARKEHSAPYGQFFCSEYVAQAYLSQGIDLCVRSAANYTSPDALSKSIRLELVGTLKKKS